MKDIPIKCIEDDRLGIHNFISSLVNIIKVGSTPFTIYLMVNGAVEKLGY